MTFRSRLLITMLSVVILAQIVTAAATLSAIRADIMASGQRNLDVGLSMLREVLDARGQRLRDTVDILTDDFGFKSAVATKDTSTLESVLINHGTRAEADMVLLADPNGRLLASSHHETGSQLPFKGLWRAAQEGQGSVEVVLQDGIPYQFVLLPVHAPNLIGWAGMGFRLDAELAKEINTLTRLPVSFIGHQLGQNQATYTATSRTDLPPEEMTQLLTALDGMGSVAELDANADYLTRARLLRRSGEDEAFALIQASRTNLMAPYRHIQWQLLALFAITLTLTAVVAAFSAKGISRPLRRLADAARRIGQGEQIADIKSGQHGEMRVLADTLMTMQEDIAQREASLLHQSRHDILTDLPNRTSAQHDVQRDIARGSGFTLLRMAIGDFRRINDTFGYALGDRVLITLSRRLDRLPAPTVQAYRIGGDEFLLRLNTPACPPDWLEALQHELAEPIDLEGSPIRPQLSFGEVRYPEDGDTPHLLMRRADVALDIARHHHHAHQRYIAGQDERHLRQLTLIRDLHDAVEQHQLTMVYQPKVLATNGNIVQFEALMRWEHPTLGFIPPDEFITLAERSGNIRMLSSWMIDTVCAQLHHWQTQGQVLRVAINLSAEDIMDETLTARLQEVLVRNGLVPDQLGLEVTESTIIKDPALATRHLEELRGAGMTLAIDDFGTGYSSLAQLKRLPVQELKIDKSFILRLDDSPDDEVIVRSTIELGQNLGLKVVAEGVENEAIRSMLKGFGCHYLQGYLIARPLPADEVTSWVERYQAQQPPTQGA
ncbi:MULTISPECIES: putative bifunctional diguanylate cyclase/phosphodiesterase [Halomonadaceae]|uniref:putative bifunctional diguanylate cyclase/phosphodiesterase n=1 Tax=Halomonadaceae TaxID=28256 RepID=UPI001583B411|nr:MULTISPECIES: EAL domain-containing protein [Halomonas]MDI4636757.1 EAL domain-containing protein [Halomonas sp. BMC7]NUJ61119.1 EAL domain-containing protein [Halomonas taeanensis]